MLEIVIRHPFHCCTPARRRSPQIIGVDHLPKPLRIQGVALGHPGVFEPAVIQIIDAPIRQRRPDELRQRFGQVTEPFLAGAQRCLGRLAGSIALFECRGGGPQRSVDLIEFSDPAYRRTDRGALA